MGRKMSQERMKEAIDAFKRGEMIIVMDDEDRENEGDLVFAGIFSTPEKINFMAQEARGLICVSITQDIADQLELTPMVGKNDSNHHTAFTVSIDAKEASTGISAYERDLTISLMCNPNSKPSDFVRPGHIFPLVAKEGGVLVRTGHTEASVDLCKIAGLMPVAVICEMMKADGSMARRGDKFLIDFAQKHNLKMLYVSDLVKYRLNSEQLVTLVSQTPANFCLKTCYKSSFVDHLGKLYEVFAFGKIGVPWVRFHHIQSDVETLQEDFKAFFKTIDLLEEYGGYLICLPNKSEEKSFGIGAQILKSLGVRDFKLLTCRVDGDYGALSGFGVNIVEMICC